VSLPFGRIHKQTTMPDGEIGITATFEVVFLGSSPSPATYNIRTDNSVLFCIYRINSNLGSVSAHQVASQHEKCVQTFCLGYLVRQLF
jgi:hypothetical protein